MSQYDTDLSEENLIDFVLRFPTNSLHKVYYALKFFYKAAGISLSLRVGDIAPRDEIHRVREIMTADEVEALIKTARQHYGTYEIGLVCLASVYGLRRIELYRMEAKDIDLGKQKFIVHTAKGGQAERVHIIPEQIREPMGDFWYVLTRIKGKPDITKYNLLFDNICFKAGIELRPMLGWHSLRRALVSQLMMVEPPINPATIRHFLGWKPFASDIILNYTLLDPVQVDKRILESGQHPFLNMWKADK